MLLLMPEFSLLPGQQELTPLLQPRQHASLLRHTNVWSVVSVVGFSPVHFQCPEPRLVSCYALFKG